jgi:hypothetical protein
MKVLSRLPFSQRSSEVSTPDGMMEVKPFQIVLRLASLPEGSNRRAISRCAASGLLIEWSVSQWIPASGGPSRGPAKCQRS